MHQIAHRDRASHTHIISMRCLQTAPGAFCDFHSHPFPEFTLVTDDSTLNGCAVGKVKSVANTLYLFHPGEAHGHWNSPKESPRFWVIHFASELCDDLEHLAKSDPHDRIWKLTVEQVAIFKWLFIKLFNEQSEPLTHHQIAESAWLQLLLVNVERWVSGDQYQELLPEQPDPDVLQLWHLVNDCVGRSADFTRKIGRLPNYDSVRHRFKDVFGASPTHLLARLRMQKARNLLLETRMSIKEIADSVGYQRQHEFARAFRRNTGQSPSEWRTHPFPKNASFSSRMAT
jgi:AraC family transcriptional regulator, arabinose operon regulatory protein